MIEEDRARGARDGRVKISILEYNWNDEKRDYWENCSDEPDDNQREGHIFLSLVVLAEFLAFFS